MLSHKSKRRIADFAVWIGIFACCCFLSAALAFPALAQEIVSGRGLICDTQEQVEKYLALAHEGDDPQLILAEVNGDTSACALALVAFVQGAEVAKTRNDLGPWSIVPILIVGANLGMGWQSVHPFEQFTAFAIKEEKS